MCILCVVQKWSRRVATMLPWLLCPIFGLWGLSHLLPDPYRFEFTSPRIACVLVLLVTIFWYEVLMPQLSAWRARNSAKYRETKRREALERQKRRKTATRLCRNCLTPYKDQNPAGGKFMCSYCGHVSKRPVLDLPEGDDGDGKGRKECLWFGCIFGGDASQSGGSGRGHSALRSNFRGRGGGDSSSSDAHCFATRLYVSACKALSLMFVKFRRFWRSVFGLSVEDDTSSDGDNENKEGENGMGCQESKGEKARRKAEEKRQARLERELLEEEERKQREEVAKLVEEQRRLRDEKMDAEKEAIRSATIDREKYAKRDAERKRQDRRKEKDKGSSKSNSDYEDSEGKAGKDTEKKRDFDKKSENGRGDIHKSTNLGVKARNSETGNTSKVTNTPAKGNSTRYLDRMKGSFMNSSKAFNGGIFGKGAHASASSSSKAGNYVDHIQPASSRREVQSTELLRKKLNLNGEDKISKTSSYQPVASEIQPQTAPKKSWRQLFTRSPAVAPFPPESFTSEPSQKFQSISHNPLVPDQASPSHPLADQISYGLPLPFSLSPFPNGSTGSSPVSSSVTEPLYPQLGDPFHDLTAEELDVFEDPCYDPEAVSLLGPVSESLNFSLDLGGAPVKDARCERPLGLNNPSPVEVTKPSPIEAPVSRLRFVEERHANYNSYPTTPKSQSLNASTLNQSTNEDADGTWKMWGTPPLGHDGLGLIGGSGNWLLPLGMNAPGHEQALHPSVHNSSTLQFPKENQIRSGTSSPQRLHMGNFQNGGMLCPANPGSNGKDPWLQQSFFQPSPGKGQNQFPPLIPWEDTSQKKVTFSGSNNASSSHSSELSPGNRWSKNDDVANGAGEGIGNSSVARPHVGGLFSSPDVHSLWAYN